jgi:hypothetical protein
MELDLVCEEGEYKQNLLGTLVRFCFFLEKSLKMNNAPKVDFYCIRESSL